MSTVTMRAPWSQACVMPRLRRVPLQTTLQYCHRMFLSAVELVRCIHQAATPVIRILDVGGRRWRRKVASGPRIGPRLPARYEILDHATWSARQPCLYLVAGDDGTVRYVGISVNRMKDRWRECPVLDADTMAHRCRRSSCSTTSAGSMSSARCRPRQGGHSRCAASMPVPWRSCWRTCCLP